MENSKTLEILKMAILMEKRGQAFYYQVASQTKSPEVKNIFEIMAKEEVLHEKYLSDQFKELQKNQKLSNVSLPTADGFDNIILSDNLKKEISAAGYEAAAISAAIDMESNAVKVYSERAISATDENEKQLFNWLANWEKGHHKILIELDNELKESIWFDNQFWPF
jgi:rubrerythrin